MINPPGFRANFCAQIINCLAGGDFKRSCIEDIFTEGILKDLEKQFSNFQSGLETIAGAGNNFVTEFLKTAGCAHNPVEKIKKAVKTIVDLLDLVFGYDKSPDFLRAMGAVDDMTKKHEKSIRNKFSDGNAYISYLSGVSLGGTFGIKTADVEMGIFVTIFIDINNENNPLKVTEIGLYRVFFLTFQN